jgi:hypothetical protein
MMRMSISKASLLALIFLQEPGYAAFQDVPESHTINPGTQLSCVVFSQDAHSIGSRADWRDTSEVLRVREVDFTFRDPVAVGSTFDVDVEYENGERLLFTAHTRFYADFGNFPELLFSTLGGTGYFYLSPLHAGIEWPGYLSLNESGWEQHGLRLYCTWQTAPQK